MCESEKGPCPCPCPCCIYATSTNSASARNTFTNAQIRHQMKNLSMSVIEKSHFPLRLYVYASSYDTLDDACSRHIQFHRLLNYNVDNLTEWKLEVARDALLRYDLRRVQLFTHDNNSASRP